MNTLTETSAEGLDAASLRLLQERVRNLELLSEKLARQVDTASWTALFRDKASTIRFEKRMLTVLHAVGVESERFAIDVAWLASRHRGQVDHFALEGSMTYFEDRADCVAMALELQRAYARTELCLGVETRPWVVATFQPGHLPFTTLIAGEGRREAAPCDLVVDEIAG